MYNRVGKPTPVIFRSKLSQLTVPESEKAKRRSKYVRRGKKNVIIKLSNKMKKFAIKLFKLTVRIYRKFCFEDFFREIFLLLDVI